MTTEIGFDKPRPIDFTFKGAPLAVRSMPLRLGIKLQSIEQDEGVPADILAEIISACVVDKKGKSIWSVDEVLDFDLEPMLKLFNEVSGVTVEDAAKN